MLASSGKHGLGVVALAVLILLLLSNFSTLLPTFQAAAASDQPSLPVAKQPSQSNLAPASTTSQSLSANTTQLVVRLTNTSFSNDFIPIGPGDYKGAQGGSIAWAGFGPSGSTTTVGYSYVDNASGRLKSANLTLPSPYASDTNGLVPVWFDRGYVSEYYKTDSSSYAIFSFNTQTRQSFTLPMFFPSPTPTDKAVGLIAQNKGPFFASIMDVKASMQVNFAVDVSNGIVNMGNYSHEIDVSSPNGAWETGVPSAYTALPGCKNAATGTTMPPELFETATPFDIIVGAPGKYAYLRLDRPLPNEGSCPYVSNPSDYRVDIALNDGTVVDSIQWNQGICGAEVRLVISCPFQLLSYWDNLLLFEVGNLNPVSLGFNETHTYLYDTTTGRTTELTNYPLDAGLGPKGPAEVYGYQVSELAFSSYGDVASDGKNLAWIQPKRISGSIYGNGPTAYLYTPQSGVTTINSSFDSGTLLGMGAGFLAWTNGTGAINVYDISSRKVQSVATNPDVQSVSLEGYQGGRVAWVSASAVYSSAGAQPKFRFALNSYNATLAAMGRPAFGTLDLSFAQSISSMQAARWVFMSELPNETAPAVTPSRAPLLALGPLSDDSSPPNTGQGAVQVVGASTRKSCFTKPSDFTTGLGTSLSAQSVTGSGLFPWGFTAGVADGVGLQFTGITTSGKPFLQSVSIPVFSVTAGTFNDTIQFSASDPHSTRIIRSTSSDNSRIYFKFTFEKDYQSPTFAGTLCISYVYAITIKPSVCEVAQLDCYRLVPTANYTWYDQLGNHPTLDQFTASQNVDYGVAGLTTTQDPDSGLPPIPYLENYQTTEHVYLAVYNGGKGQIDNVHTGYPAGLESVENPLRIVLVPTCRPDGFDCVHQHFRWGALSVPYLPAVPWHWGTPAFLEIDPMVDPLNGSQYSPSLNGTPYLFPGQTVYVALVANTPSPGGVTLPTAFSQLREMVSGRREISTTTIDKISWYVNNIPGAKLTGTNLLNTQVVLTGALPVVQWTLDIVHNAKSATFFRNGVYTLDEIHTAKKVELAAGATMIGLVRRFSGDPPVNVTQIGALYNETVKDQYWLPDENSLVPASADKVFQDFATMAQSLDELKVEHPELAPQIDNVTQTVIEVANLVSSNTIVQAAGRYQIMSAIDNATGHSDAGLTSSLSSALVALNQSVRSAFAGFITPTNDSGSTVNSFQRAWDSARSANMTDYSFVMSQSPSTNSSTESSTNSGATPSFGQVSIPSFNSMGSIIVPLAVVAVIVVVVGFVAYRRRSR